MKIIPVRSLLEIQLISISDLIFAIDELDKNLQMFRTTHARPPAANSHCSPPPFPPRSSLLPCRPLLWQSNKTNPVNQVRLIGFLETGLQISNTSVLTQKRESIVLLVSHTNRVAMILEENFHYYVLLARRLSRVS